MDVNLKNTIQKAPGMNNATMNEMVKQAEIPMIEPMPNHIIKAYYTLRLLKARDHKIKLLHVLNYFRAIQKRLALDISEFYTREKAVGDLEIIPPQFGTDQAGNLRTFQNGINGPGNIFAL